MCIGQRIHRILLTEMNIVIYKKAFPQFLEELKGAHRCYGPVKKGGVFCFAPIEDTGEIDLDASNPIISAKGLFLPQSEKMLECSLDPEQEESHIFKALTGKSGSRVVVGIRPCDARALTLVDANFDTQTYRDPWWKEARESTILVGLGCHQPCATCFCTSVGGGPYDETSLDILLMDMGETFIAKTITKKGEGLLKACGGYDEAGPETMEKAEQVTAQAREKISIQVDTSRLASMDTAALYDAEFWEDVQFSCINCGTCTFLCPTCWCFDIQDETCGSRAIRMRNWDSCMFPIFTQHASGHNPRGTKLHRVRQRFMHKMKYYVDKYSDGVACVGCGRCIQHCPVNIDIIEVIRLMNESGNLP
jgi:ferredoxin